MNNYLLSIDPSIKNTGFTLWEKECEINCKYLWKPIETNTQHTNDIWKPIFVKSYNFNKYKDIVDYDLQGITYKNNFRVEWQLFLGLFFGRHFFLIFNWG